MKGRISAVASERRLRTAKAAMMGRCHDECVVWGLSVEIVQVLDLGGEDSVGGEQ